MEENFIKYRKLIIAGIVFAFIYSAYEMYRGVDLILSSQKGQGIGAILDSAVFLFLGMYFIIKIREAKRNLVREKMPRE
jgi:hypothetical protein